MRRTDVSVHLALAPRSGSVAGQVPAGTAVGLPDERVFPCLAAPLLAETAGPTAGASAPPALVGHVSHALRGPGPLAVAEHRSAVRDVRLAPPASVRTP